MLQRRETGLWTGHAVEALYTTAHALVQALASAHTRPGMQDARARNAFGYYHAASLIKEYTPEHPRLDLLNITPGAVLTENTAHTLSGTPFAVSPDAFVGTVMRFLGGNVPNGSTCAHWGHALSAAFVGVAPWRKEPTLREVGERLAGDYMKRYGERRGRYVVA